MVAPPCSMRHEGPWEERLPLLPGANTTLIALAAMGHGSAAWTVWRWPYGRSANQLPSAAALFTCALFTVEENAWDQGKHPNPS